MSRKIALPLLVAAALVSIILASRTPQPIIEELPPEEADAPTALPTQIEEVGEQTTFLATNIASSRKFNIETPDVVVKVNPEAADLVETRIIDGRQCLVIAINEHVEVNGISIAVAPEGITDHED